MGFVTSHRGLRVRSERNPHGKGRWLLVQLGPGAGYRWFDLPGHSMNVAHRVRRRLSVSGRTMYVGTHVKVSYLHDELPKRNRKKVLVRRRRESALLYVTALSRQCNRDVYPGWW